MTSASSLSTHVADHTRHRKPIGYHFCVGARAGGRAPRVNCGPMYQNLTEILPAPIFQSAAPTPPGSGNWRRTIERNPNLAALVRRHLLQWGHTGLLNFCRTILAAGKPSLSFVHDANQPTNGIFHGFSLSPVLSLSVLHARNMQQKDARSHEQCTREYE